MGDNFSSILSNIEKNRVDFTLDNGLKVVLLNIDGAESVNITLGVGAGSLYEGKVGVAYLTSKVLLFKNKKYGILEIPKYIESLGGSIDSTATHDIASISIKCLYEDIYNVLPKLLDVLTDFYVDDEVLGIVKPNIISQIKLRDDDPWDFTRKIFLKELYGDHPYGREPEGDEKSVEDISKEDVMNFFQNFYTPDNAILVIVGKIDSKNLRQFIQTNFSRWKGKKFNFKIPSFEVKSRGNYVKVSKDLKQSTIRVGHLSTNIKDPKRVELKILNFILGGGGFGSRLMEKIREKEGLAYGVTSNFYIDRMLDGYFFVGTQTENKNVNKVIEMITNEIRSIIENGVSDKELDDTKKFLEGSLLLSMESFSTIASFLITEKFFDLERNYFVKDVEKISVIRKEDINRVARDYFKPDNFTIVVVGGE